jgi:glutamine amidotransferase
MASQRVVVVDYGMGNLWSVASGLGYLGAEAQISGRPEEVLAADALVLPGVGSFRRAMDALRVSGLADAIVENVRGRGTWILGICLGMQLLGAHGSEDGETEGLGLVPNRVDRFTDVELGARKSPHIGFNTVRSAQDRLFRGLPERADFYFVHSYRMLPETLRKGVATCTYGIDFLAAFETGNVCGTQFHPEKSQTNGLVLLRNFLRASAQC